MSKPAGDSQAPVNYARLFNELPESHLLFEANDPIYTIVDINVAREELTNTSRTSAVGKPLFEVYPDTSDTYKTTGKSYVHEQLQRILKTGKAVSMPMFRYDIKDGSGELTERYWQAIYQPVRGATGAITHILATTYDVTAEQATETRILRAEQRLEAALAIGKVGSWVWDVTKDVVVADSNLAKMFNIDTHVADTGLPLELFLLSIHQDDRERVQLALHYSLDTLTPFEEEYRTQTGHGTLQWVLARGSVEERTSGKLFTGVIVDITERRDLQAQVELARQQDKLNQQASRILQDRNEELEAIARTKDEFVALASHQLRTPATAVKQYLGMVLQGYVGDVTEVQTEMLSKAFESNERQIEIINQILNAARADTGRLIMAPVPLDLRTLTQGVADDMLASMEQHGHQFSLHLPKTPVPIVADLGYLRMAIENLLHNACIYTPDGGTITMTLAKIGKQCRLSITDTGVGIKKTDIGKLFAKFSRIHNALSVQAGGSGIGLYLVAEIIRLHQGTVSVDSKIGKGTTFGISLPLVP